MARTIPQREPTKVYAGDSWKWDRLFSDYPAGDGWQLSYLVRGPVDIDLAWATEVTANGDTFEVRVEETKTDDLTTAGRYRLIGRVTDGTDTYVVHNDVLIVLANPATAVGSTTHARATLDLIEAAIEGRVPADRQDYQINGRAITHIPIMELMGLRGIYAAMVWGEENPGRSLPQHKVSFRAPR